MLARSIYQILLYLLLPFILLRLFWRSKSSPEYRRRIGERFGFLPFKLRRCIWVHAVSVGETIAAAPLIEQLKDTYPDAEILVTSTTPTGSNCVKKMFGSSVMHLYAPYDVGLVVKRFLRLTSPQLILIMETEIWPNLVIQAHKENIPLVIANARMSDRSYRRYHRFRSLSQPIFKKLPLVSSQSQADAMRFVKLGVPRENVEIAGSLKFDLNLPEDLAVQGARLRREWGADRLVWIVASTHDKEEQIMLKIYYELKVKYPNLLLVLVPRHPERFESVAKMIEKQQLVHVKRSLGEPVSDSVQVLLGDTMGELLLLYSACDFAVMGGSFVAVGGHNMLEPMACGVPTVVGPHMFNFQSITDMLLENRVLIQARNEEQLCVELDRLCLNHNLRSRLADRGAELIRENRGALDRLLSQINRLVV